MIILNKKLIFIHPLKSGGTSIENMLAPLYEPNSKSPAHQIVNRFWATGGKHLTLQKIYSTLPDKDLNKYTIFFVFRNTFNRVKSAYNWMQRFHKHKIKTDWSSWMKDLETYFTTGILPPTVDPVWVCRIQDFINIPGVLDVSDLNLTIENKILVLKNDKVKIHMLRLEYLNKDWHNFKHIIGLPRQLIAHENRHHHSKESYLSEYTDEQKETIQKHYHFEMNILNSEEYKSIC